MRHLNGSNNPFHNAGGGGGELCMNPASCVTYYRLYCQCSKIEG